MHEKGGGGCWGAGGGGRGRMRVRVEYPSHCSALHIDRCTRGVHLGHIGAA